MTSDWRIRIFSPLAEPLRRAHSRVAKVHHGALMALVAYWMFTSSDLLIKSLTARLSIFQIMFLQLCSASVPLFIAFLQERAASRSAFRPVRSYLLLGLRGALAGIGTLLGFMAFSVLPLTDVYAIAFGAPLIVTLASGVVLGERISGRQIIATPLGLAGVLVVLQPGLSSPNVGYLAAVGSMLSGAAVILTMRKLGRVERAVTVLAAILGGLAAIAIPGAIATWKPAEWFDVLIAGCSGALMATAHLMMYGALRRDAAATIAPLQYTILLWASLYGWIVFDQFPPASTIAGCLIIVVANVCGAFGRK